MSTPDTSPDGPTPAQITANRKNAQRSTGPRTQDGKARSRQNALRHGVYASVEVAVKRGPFAEDPEEVDELLAQLVEALAPRDIHEECRARRIAMLQLQERRLDAYEATLLQQVEVAARLEREQVTDAMNDDIRDHVVTWNTARFDDAAPQSDAPKGAPWPWDLMACWLRGALGDHPRVSGLWDAAHEPKGQDQWRRAFEVIAGRRFPTAQAMAAFLCAHRDRAAVDTDIRTEHGRRQVATASLATLDDCNRRRARITNELLKQWAMYAQLKARQPTVEK